MRELLISAARSYYMGLLNRHISNVEVLLTNPMGISGVADKHQDIQEAIEVELGIIADYNDKLEVLQRFFIKPQNETKEETTKNETTKK
jgi:hypothetical protein|tara:strand:- start:217 stop:483 length:267 start_codon:yes stop_codon:yes gene_type:complete